MLVSQTDIMIRLLSSWYWCTTSIIIKDNFLEPVLLVIKNIILILQDKQDRKLHKLEMDAIIFNKCKKLQFNTLQKSAMSLF